MCIRDSLSELLGINLKLPLSLVRGRSKSSISSDRIAPRSHVANAIGARSLSQGIEKRNLSLSRFSWLFYLRFIQPKKFRDMIRRGDTRLDHEGAGNPAP